jgi:hypothetical protein
MIMAHMISGSDRPRNPLCLLRIRGIANQRNRELLYYYELFLGKGNVGHSDAVSQLAVLKPGGAPCAP